MKHKIHYEEPNLKRSISMAAERGEKGRSTVQIDNDHLQLGEFSTQIGREAKLNRSLEGE